MNTIDTIEAIEPAPGFRLFGPLARWTARRLEIRRTRVDLLDLTDDQLRDIGVNPADARREAIRPLWR